MRSMGDTDPLTLTFAQLQRLPEEGLRRAFCEIVNTLIGSFGKALMAGPSSPQLSRRAGTFIWTAELHQWPAGGDGYTRASLRSPRPGLLCADARRPARP